MQIKNKYINQFLQSSIVRNTGILFSGNVLAQVITLLAYPAITRLYSPDEMGAFNLFVSIFSICVLLANAEYHQVLVFHKREQEIPSVLGLCVGCVCLVFVLLLGAIPFSASIASLFDAPSLASWFWVLPFYVCATSLWLILENLLIRRKAFHYISFYLILVAFSNAVLKILLGSMGMGLGGLMISAVTVSIFSLLVVLLYAQYKDAIFSFFPKQNKMPDVAYQRPTVASCQNIGQTYIKFPKYSLSRQFLNLFSKSLPIFLLSAPFGMQVIGWYSMGLLLAHTPINVVCASLYKILFRHVSEKVCNEQPILPLLMRYISLVLLLGIPFFLVLYVILPDFTALLLGDEWRMSGEYIRLMLPWLLAYAVADVLDFLPQLFKKQEGLLVVEIIDLALKLAVLALGIHSNNFYLALLLYFAVCFVVNAGKAIWLMVLARNYEKGKLSC